MERGWEVPWGARQKAEQRSRGHATGVQWASRGGRGLVAGAWEAVSTVGGPLWYLEFCLTDSLICLLTGYLDHRGLSDQRQSLAVPTKTGQEFPVWISDPKAMHLHPLVMPVSQVGDGGIGSAADSRKV